MSADRAGRGGHVRCLTARGCAAAGGRRAGGHAVASVAPRDRAAQSHRQGPGHGMGGRGPAGLVAQLPWGHGGLGPSGMGLWLLQPRRESGGEPCPAPAGPILPQSCPNHTPILPHWPHPTPILPHPAPILPQSRPILPQFCPNPAPLAPSCPNPAPLSPSCPISPIHPHQSHSILGGPSPPPRTQPSSGGPDPAAGGSSRRQGVGGGGLAACLTEEPGVKNKRRGRAKRKWRCQRRLLGDGDRTRVSRPPQGPSRAAPGSTGKGRDGGTDSWASRRGRCRDMGTGGRCPARCGQGTERPWCGGDGHGNGGKARAGPPCTR